MHYELWREDSLNLQGSWPTEAEALAGVREVLARPKAPVERYALARVDARGEYHTVAEGLKLADLARRSAPSRPPRRRRAA